MHEEQVQTNGTRTTLSILIPVRDEAPNLKPFHKKLLDAIENINYDTEIFYIENGSHDNTEEALQQLDGASCIILRVDETSRKSEETAAIAAGIDCSSGNTIATIDADLQNDPADLHILLKKLEEGYDAVIGWRQKRKGPLSLRIVSRLGQLLRKMFGFSVIHDPGCGLKVYRRTCVENLILYGELERFFPDLLVTQGWKVTETKIPHYPRYAGQSKYPWTKGLRALSDLVGLWFWRRYADRPIQFFGSLGIALGVMGSAMWTTMGILRLFGLITLSSRIWPMVATTFIVVGMQLFFFGLLADILARMHYAQYKPYRIKHIIGRNSLHHAAPQPPKAHPYRSRTKIPT